MNKVTYLFLLCSLFTAMPVIVKGMEERLRLSKRKISRINYKTTKMRKKLEIKSDTKRVRESGIEIEEQQAWSSMMQNIILNDLFSKEELELINELSDEEKYDDFITYVNSGLKNQTRLRLEKL